MSYTSLTKPASGSATKKSLADGIIDNLNDLNGRVALVEGAGLLNGSFQQDGDGDGYPDGWQVDTAGGGTVGLSTSVYYHASQSAAITLGAANQYADLLSGETAAVADYVPCGPSVRHEFGWAVRGTAGAPAWKVLVRWYTAAGTQVGSDVTLGSGTIGTGWGTYWAHAVSPATAYYYRLVLRGGDTSSAAGTVYYDAVGSRVFHGPVPVARTSLASISTDTTTNVYVTSLVGSGELARFVNVELVYTRMTDTQAVTVQGWVGGAWVTVNSYQTGGGNTARVPLSGDNRFRVVTTGTGAGDSVTVYAAGAFEV